MTTYKLNTFQGEAPSVSDRALSGNFARVNSNLFLPSPEFWPLSTDKRHSSCVAGTLTLHRFHRDSSGAVIQDPTAPIRSYAKELSFVKGQINDEATERTYYTTDDGSVRPRTIDARGADRLLGVVRPIKPIVEAKVVDEFTPDEARVWVFGDLAEMVKADILRNVIKHESNQIAVRWDGTGKSYSGVSTNHGLSLSTNVNGNPQYLYAIVSAARAKSTGLDATRLSALPSGDGFAIPVSAMPYSYPFRDGDLVQALQLHEFPDIAGSRSGETVFTPAQAGDLADAIKAYTAPGSECASWRNELNTLVKEFSDVALSKSWTNAGAAPVKPVLPTVAQWSQNSSDQMIENPVWITYRAQLEAYNTALAKYNADVAEGKQQANSFNSRLIEIQQRAATLVQSINSQLSKQYTTLIDDLSVVGEMLSGLGGVTAIAGDELTERVIDSRFYVVSFVTDWGEESEPSPFSEMLEVDANDTVTIQRPQAMTGELHSSRNVQSWRIYRSNTSSTSAAWQLVKDVPISVNSFLDDKASEELDSLQPQFTWTAPPYRMDSQFSGDNKPSVGLNPYLRGLKGMPNGIMAGFIDNTVAFCEPYIPYAWPVEYQISTEYPIVGFGVFDQTLFVGTTGNPYLMTGAHSASMTAIKLDSNQSCVARRTIVGVQGGVLYASPDGLCLASQSGVEVVTRNLFAREFWQSLKPLTMFAAEHEGVYYLFYAGNGGGCYAFSMKDGWKLGRVDLKGSAVWVDKFNDLMYLASGTDLMECFSGGALRKAKWRTGISTQGAQHPLAWIKVYGQQTNDKPVTVKLYGDGVLRHTATFKNLQPQRLPPGRWLEHIVEIEAAVRLNSVVICSTSEELKSI